MNRSVIGAALASALAVAGAAAQEGPTAAPAPPAAPRADMATQEAPAQERAPEAETDAVRRAPSAGPVALLRGLDKFSGRVETFEAPVGGVVDFARLVVGVNACEDSGDGPRVHLEIVDRARPDAVAFLGWMFAEDPSLSALDHARFDVWLLACKTSSGDAS
ncbi:MAG: DUF2155 domain-containing protein [Rhodobacteraceae bacterium]|nr:MAG: DUF2155 domain-containing protein [Paracoccaceae bacterium]